MIENSLVIDASVAIKWIVPEEDFEIARQLRFHHRLIAPQLIYAECANILWKKARRGEMTAEEIHEAAGFIDTSSVETVSMHGLTSLALQLSLRLDHPAYDCFYIALAVLQDCPFATADDKLLRKVNTRLSEEDSKRCIMLRRFGPPSQ